MENIKKDLNYFKNLEYKMFLKKVNNKFILYIPELSIYAEDKNLNTVYKKIENMKENYFKKMIDLDQEYLINKPSKDQNNWKKISGIVIFSVIFVLSLNFSIDYFTLKIKNIIPRLISEISESPRAFFLNSLFNGINSMTAEEKQEITIIISKIIRDNKVYIKNITNEWNR